MKKIFFVMSFAITFFFCRELVAQTLPNSDFENWTSSGNQPPFDWFQPTGWISTNSLTEWTFAGVTKSTTHENGSYACRLQNVFIGSGWFTAVCNGNPKLFSSFSTPDINIITGGTPISTKPEKLTGYYILDNGSANDSAYVVVILKKYNSTLSKIDTVGLGHLYFLKQTAYTYFEVNITDMAPAVTPDSIVVAFYSSDPKNPKAPNFTKPGLLIDNLSLSSGNAVGEIKMGHQAMIYPNPSSSEITIEGLNEGIAKIISIDGRIIKQVTVSKSKKEVDVSDLNEGVYFINSIDENHNFFNAKFIKLNNK